MENSTFFDEKQNSAQNYYPKALCLGQETNSSPQTQTQSPLANLFSSLVGQNSFSQSLPAQFSKMVADNPILSALLSGNLNQSDLMSKLLSPSPPKAEKVKPLSIDLSDSVEEL